MKDMATSDGGLNFILGNEASMTDYQKSNEKMTEFFTDIRINF